MNVMKYVIRANIILLCVLCMNVFFQSCREDLEGALPVIKEEQIGEYLQNNPDFSLFSRMLDTTGVLGLLKAYGMYTVFAPTNTAVEDYLASLEDIEGNHTITSISQLPLSDIKAFCYNHIVKGDTIRTSDMTKGALSSQSMSGRFLSVSFSKNSPLTFINENSPIIGPDIKRHNGYLHIMGKVLAPARIKLGEVFEGDSTFSIYARALALTGLSNIMNLAPAEDESFDPKADTRYLASHTVPEEHPTSRKFGFTIIAVADSDLVKYRNSEIPGLENGIRTVADLEKLAKHYYGEVYNHDADNVTDYKNRKNYLNRFMSYHCFDRILLSSRFVKDLFTPHHFSQYPMYEYIETMLDNTLVEVVLDKTGKDIGNDRFANPNYIFGVFNMGDPAQGCLFTSNQNKPNGGSLNGFYHGIDKPIIYSKKYLANLSSKRLRLDAASFFPELSSNNMRGNNPGAVSGVVGKTHYYLMPPTYLENFTGTANCRFSYLGATSIWEDYQGDELFLNGSYNFTIKTAPIPPGTYEIRMGYQATPQRGIAQLYLDSLPCGIPLNLSLLATDPGVGWEQPGTNRDDADGYENDKMMHNRGYMKGAACFGSAEKNVYNSENTRVSPRCLRRILGVYTFTEAKKHYFTAISLGSTSSGTQFMLDYLEFCPIELLETEDVN